ncbi:hypothetical protein [Haloarchaeobius sp. HRN-SO-5]|uniref:hypothetical protein n=1 Tax=Haloarchaeobius sp. HRN-SO-5 TaxID=3446118 RepID=UPI003EB97A58
MADHARIEFSLPSRDTEERFVREYAVDTVERLHDDPACEKFVYIRAGEADQFDGGGIVVDIHGDAETVVDGERERWDALVEDGLVTDWEHADVALVERLTDYYGADGAELAEHLRYVATRMSTAAVEELDGQVAPEDAYPDEGEGPVGWWNVLHILSNQQGYTGEEELDSVMRIVENGLVNYAAAHGEAAANEKVDELIADLEATREELSAYVDYDEDEEVAQGSE